MTRGAAIMGLRKMNKMATRSKRGIKKFHSIIEIDFKIMFTKSTFEYITDSKSSKAI